MLLLEELLLILFPELRFLSLASFLLENLKVPDAKAYALLGARRKALQVLARETLESPAEI